MRNMAKTLAFLGAVFTAVSISAEPSLADGILANDPALAAYTLQYGDFNVVSLAFANEATGTNNYYVGSSPGQISNDLVLGTGSGGSFANGTPNAAMSLSGADAPYVTPNGSQLTYFATGNATSAPHPGPLNQFSGDAANSWNITVATLNSTLGNQAPVFYLNMHDNGVSNVLSGTDLLFWMSVTLTAGANNAPAQTFYLAGNPFDPNGGMNGTNLSIANGRPDATLSYADPAASLCNPTDPQFGCLYDPTDPRWTYVHGDICVNGSLLEHYGACVGNEGTTVNQDLGANQAAFAAYDTTLNSLLSNPDYANSTLQVNFEMADENGGYETLFILPGGNLSSTSVAEPLTLSLFGAGLMGAAILRRRKRARDLTV